MMKTVLGLTNYYECRPDVWQSDDSAFVSSETHLPICRASQVAKHAFFFLVRYDHLNCVGPAAIAMANLQTFRE